MLLWNTACLPCTRLYLGLSYICIPPTTDKISRRGNALHCNSYAVSDCSARVIVRYQRCTDSLLQPLLRGQCPSRYTMWGKQIDLNIVARASQLRINWLVTVFFDFVLDFKAPKGHHLWHTEAENRDAGVNTRRWKCGQVVSILLRRHVKHYHCKHPSYYMAALCVLPSKATFFVKILPLHSMTW